MTNASSETIYVYHLNWLNGANTPPQRAKGRES